jgi:hypothetical protein
MLEVSKLKEMKKKKMAKSTEDAYKKQREIRTDS